jgi:hypothetical protein
LGDESKERDVARRYGFARPRPLVPLVSFEPLDPSALATISQRLGLRSGSRVALVGVSDPGIASLKSGTSLQVSSMVPPEPVDVIIYQAESPFALRRVSELSKLVKPRGVLWVLWPNNGRHLTKDHVERACSLTGMTCTWTTGVTGRLSGMKFIHRFADGR